MRQIVTLDCKAHVGTHALFHLWQQFNCYRQCEPGERYYVLVADCCRHDGAPCEVWAVVDTDENGEERVTLRLADEELLTSTL